MKLQGKRAIVTGSSISIGRSIALLLAAQGARVIVNARGSGPGGGDAMESTVEEIRSKGGTVIAVAGSVGDPEFASELVEKCVEAFGSVDILINNAGICPEAALGPVHQCPLDVWEQTLRINLDGVFHTSRAALHHMIRQRWGRIVNAGSWAGFGKMGGSAYSASKSAIFGFSRAMAADFGPYGITVNTYNPEALSTMGGNVDRNVHLTMIRRWEEKGWRTPAESAYLEDLGGADGIAPWVAYLCTDEADYLNGRVFAVESRRIAMIAEPDETRIMLRNAGREGPWSLDELSSLAPLAFPVANSWPRREGAELERWERA
jgi:3-oxoacyl-[acyl-carrier protein] reductase